MANEVTAKFFARHLWKAQPSRGVPPLKSPVGNVVSLWSETDTCSTPEQCQLIMQDLQTKHMSQNLSDIQSNFYIGGDGNIYEGRGWYGSSPEYPKAYKFADKLIGDCIEIAFIGRCFRGEMPDKLQMNGSSDILTIGTIEKYLKTKLDFYFITPMGMEFLETFILDSEKSIYLPANQRSS